MKDDYYFSHDYNPRSDEKIKKLIRSKGMLGYGIFWAIIEDLYNNANALQTDYDGIAYDLHTDSDTIKSVINDYDLFIINDGFFSSESVRRRLDVRAIKSDKARESASYRWDKSKRNANAMRTHSDRNAIKERKVNSNVDILNDLGWINDEPLYNGLVKNFPKLFQLKRPLTYDQHCLLVQKYESAPVKQIYMEMENYAPLLKKSESAYLTASNWLNRKKNDTGRK